jgi:hypothetical protein
MGVGNFAKMIGYRGGPGGVPSGSECRNAGTMDATDAGNLAVDLLLMQQIAKSAQLWIVDCSVRNDHIGSETRQYRERSARWMSA